MFYISCLPATLSVDDNARLGSVLQLALLKWGHWVGDLPELNVSLAKKEKQIEEAPMIASNNCQPSTVSAGKLLLAD